MTYNPKAHGARCDICPLNEARLKGELSLVPPETSSHVRLVLIGEAPGRNEEKVGRPFVGQSGKLLEKHLPIAREDCHITNAALCRTDNDKVQAIAAACCAPRLLREIRPFDAPIVTMGKLATKSVLGVKSILLARGFVWEAPEIDRYRLEGLERTARGAVSDRKAEMWLKAKTARRRASLAGRRVFPILHPAFILRAETWYPIFVNDLERVGRFLKNPDRVLEDAGDHLVGGPSILKDLGPVTSCDVETDDIFPRETKMLCVGMSDGVRTRVVWPWKPKYAKALTRHLGRRKVIFHNGNNFDLLVLRNHDVAAPADIEDTLIAHHAYASHLPHRLDHCVTEHLDSAPWKIAYGMKGAEEKGLPAKEMSGEALTLYNAADCRLTAKLWHEMQSALQPEWAVYRHDMRLAAISREMQWNGIYVDRTKKDELSAELAVEADRCIKEMRILLDSPEFSPARLGMVREALFSQLKCAYVAFTASGIPSTSNVTLEKLADANAPDSVVHRFARLLLRWRGVTKTKNTYVDAVRVHPDTGCAHYNWRSFGTVSGRFASRLQSAPRYNRADIAARVRELYIPRSPDRTFVYFDVSQAEMRLAAYLSNDPTFIETCKGDVHAGNARVLFPGAAERGWFDDKEALKDPLRGKKFRDISKNIGFAITYLAEADKVYITLRAKGFQVSLLECERILMKLRSAYRRYYQYVEENVARVKRDGYLRDVVTGRIRWFGWWPKPTEIANAPVQGALAGAMNRKTIQIDDNIRDSRIDAILVAQIHDACIFDTSNSDVGKLEELLRHVWLEPIPNLPGGPLVLPIDMKTGKSWAELG